MSDTRRIRAVGGVVLDESGRLLVIRRGHEPDAGRWTLPGGRLEPGESEEGALRRELREETGLSVRVGRLAGRLRRGRYDITDYHCRVVGGRAVAGDDAAELRWVTSGELAALDTTAGLPELLIDWGVWPDRSPPAPDGR